MRRYIKFLLKVSLLLSPILVNGQKTEGPLVLWYNHPSSVWEEAIPLGNGKLGAMVFGKVNHELLQLNDNTLWSGYPNPGNNPNGPKYLPLVRKAVEEGNYQLAAQYWKKMQGPYSARYLPIADLHLDFHLKDTIVADYKRSLDLNSAIASVGYKSQGTTFNREIFTSFPGQVMVVRLTASKKKQISFTAGFRSKLQHTIKIQESMLTVKGKAPMHVAHRNSEPLQIIYDKSGEGMTFSVFLKIANDGGTVQYTDSTITVMNANEVTLFLSGDTSFNGFDKSPGHDGKDPDVQPLQNIRANTTKSYTQLKADHISDYQKLFKRVSFQLGKSAQPPNIPTDDELLQYNGSGVHLPVLYYQFGRYLMISCSRPGSPPANLQGMWNQHVQPPWGSNYTININTEMNYWPSESTNLSECHEPLLAFIRNLSINGKETAKINYDIDDAWCAHHNSDIWAKTSPPGGFEWDPNSRARWSCWPMAGAWMSLHLWEHYLYTGDEKYLREEAWPVMRDAAKFLLSWLQENPDGYLVTNPSSSPENVFRQNGEEGEISMASTMDMAITRELFRACLLAGEKIEGENDFKEKVSKSMEKLYPYQIGQYGQLQEWYKDWDDPNDKHRHLSHLFGLHPGSQISPIVTPELATAAKQSMVHRGDVSTGWSMAWKINWWARLYDGNHALKILRDGLQYVGPKIDENNRGGTYPNLFDAHPPFQIDGNFGGTAGITEMLMQSHLGEIHLLPALPDEWSEGAISGIRARGGFEIKMEWENGVVKKVLITSTLGGNCRVRSLNALKVLEVPQVVATGKNPNSLMTAPEVLPFVDHSTSGNGNINAHESSVIDFQTEKGKTYTLIAE